MREPRQNRPRVLNLRGVSSADPNGGVTPAPEPDIPATVGVEVHSGVPGWTELQPGLWQNEAGGLTPGRYFAVVDPSQWDTAQCQIDDNGNLYCPAESYSPHTVTSTTTNPPPPTVTQTPNLVVTQPATVQNAAQPALAGGSWWWLILLAIYLLSRKDK